MIRNTYGSLTVIGFDHITQVATVKCLCGSVEGYLRRRLVEGKYRECRKCASHKRYVASLKLDMSLLKDLSIADAAKVLNAYAQHIETSHRNNIRATGFKTFVREKLADPDFAKEEETTDQSFEAKLMRSNPQRYHQYGWPTPITVK